MATKSPNPLLGLFLAFFSHLILDSLPHKEYSISNIKKGDWKKSATDFLKISLDILFGILIIFLFSKNIPLAILGGFFAALPDGLSFLFFVFPQMKILNFLNRFHRKTHWFELEKIKNKIPLFWRIAIQPIIIILSIFLSLR